LSKAEQKGELAAHGTFSRSHNQALIEHRRLARLEALLSGMPGDPELRLLLEELDPGPGGSFTWLDPRNTAIAVLPASHALPVQVLLELRGGNQLGVLITSGEGMGRGAPLSHGVLEQVLDQLQALIPTSELQFRSDRDGPISRVAVTH
jgi:hypothetical protein